MKNNQTKKGSKSMIIAAIIVGVIVGLNLIGFAVNKIFFSNELQSVTPYGEMVEVHGQKMHVYSMGSGAETIVLLPGFGVSLPSADFGPLMRELSKQYTVVCVEYFGIGFSEQTESPRTNENITEEIRTALSLAGFSAPYILMPHSASGIYSEYYAAKYPEEVSAIVMLDTTSTAVDAKGNMPKFVYGIGKLQQATGLTRLTMGLVPTTQKEENGYTAKEIADYKLFTMHVLNDTMIDQSFRMIDNILEVKALPFPVDVPVLKIITTQSVKRVGEAYQADHLKRLGANVPSILIDSTHFIYQTHVADLIKATQDFLHQIND
jgi:pimeloyl-ACP methyl ester carboxylesterase